MFVIIIVHVMIKHKPNQAKQVYVLTLRVTAGMRYGDVHLNTH